ncbi:hypothetical protein F2Q70_00038656 [Brassica cretica]|uniref:Uncharacterized protein n=1 Tax=Brassica cretica TaxID=69181 RepID=A0A8S9K202_BRACR|nr:hypothetical protein F2Q70_00038656 [Brassica cretica]
MSSSSNFQKSCDVEMADAAGASSSAPPATGEVPAHIVEFCSFQRELARCDAEGTVKPTRSVSLRPVVPVDALTPEVPRVCDTVPSGGVVAMDVSTPKVVSLLEFNLPCCQYQPPWVWMGGTLEIILSIDLTIYYILLT